jgi:hypothetical protein
MFFADPVAAFSNVRRALTSGGRVRFMVFQELENNEWLMAIRESLAMGRELPTPPPGAPSPFGLADRDRARSIFADAGFTDIGFDPVVESLHLGPDAESAYAFASSMCPVQGMLADLDASTKAAALETLRASIDAHSTSDGVQFGAAGWLISARVA